MDIKRCSMCKKEKNINDFRNEKFSWCKVCNQEYGKQYRENNREKIKTSHKGWRDNNQGKIKALSDEYVKNNREKIKKKCKEWAGNNPDKVKASWLRRKFGISLDAYKNMSENQGNICAICLRLF